MRIQIEKLSFGGAGIGRAGGKVIFVKGGFPGDVLRVQIVKEKGRYAEAEIEEIVEPCSQRTQPPCPVFGKCGGCQWQSLEYSSQLKEKENILKETLERIGGLREIEVQPIVPSPDIYGYRNRVTLSVWFSERRHKVGYYEQGSLRRIPITGCPIALRPIEETICHLSEFLSLTNALPRGLERIYIASEGQTAYLTLAPPIGEDPKRLTPLGNLLRESFGTENVSILGEDEKEFKFTSVGLKFHSTPSLFSQANGGINERLVETLLEWADMKGDERVLDLYCGIGNFSLQIARRAREVMAVDVGDKAIRLAKRNAEANSITNVIFDAAPSELFVEQSLRRGDKFDLIVLDPPREGAKEIIDFLGKLSPQKIIYVSCDPATLARDLKRLGELGYKTLRIRPFDMFPQTYHIESLALLARI